MTTVTPGQLIPDGLARRLAGHLRPERGRTARRPVLDRPGAPRHG